MTVARGQIEGAAAVTLAVGAALRRCGVGPGCAVVVGVSGGADSVALLAAMGELAEELRPELTVAHLDHGLRPDAPADAQFVRHLAAERNIPAVLERADVHGARRGGESLEQAARRVRYDFLLAAARRVGASFVATGHHAGDDVETILLNTRRGCHLRGLGGMPPARPLGEGVTLVRPLLAVGREQVEAFCRDRGLAWREDHTNDDTRFARNHVRHRLLPALREVLGEGVDGQLLRLASAARRLDDWMTALADEFLDAHMTLTGGPDGEARVELAALAQLPVPLRDQVLREMLRRQGVPLRNVNAARMRELAEVASRQRTAANLPGGHICRIRRTGRVRWLTIS
jgi:tRNA(Ile)-lysidine synthase